MTLARAGMSMIPVIGGPAEVVLGRLADRQQRKVLRMLTDIIGPGGDHRPLLDRLASHPELEALFVQGVQAAVRTGVDAKVRLLAEVISRAVLDDATVDTAQFYVQVLSDLDAPHFRALERIERARRQAQELEQEEGVTDASQSLRRAQFVERVLKAEPEPVIAGLVRHGCANRLPNALVAGAEYPVITAFGRELLEEIRRFDGSEQVTQRGAQTRAEGPRGPAIP